jgi:hypothetical protein
LIVPAHARKAEQDPMHDRRTPVTKITQADHPHRTTPPSVMVVAHSLSSTRIRAPASRSPRMPIPAEERSALHPLPSRTPRASPQGPSGNGRPNLFTMSNSGGHAALGQTRPEHAPIRVKSARGTAAREGRSDRSNASIEDRHPGTAMPPGTKRRTQETEDRRPKPPSPVHRVPAPAGLIPAARRFPITVF